MIDPSDLVNEYIMALRGLAEIDIVFTGRDEIILKGVMVDPSEHTRWRIIETISRLPGKATLLSFPPAAVIKIIMPQAIGIKRFPWANATLFALTLISTLIVGAGFERADLFSDPGQLLKQPWLVIKAGMPFSFSLLGILLFHEFGHYIVSRKHGVKVSLPYFIPAPNFIGTMGAVIRSKSPFITRNQLLDVGAAGPLAGMLIAIPLTIWGLSQPKFIPVEVGTENLITLGDSLLFALINKLVAPPTPDGFIPLLNSVAFAGWVGFLVTMLNLMPLGQLDGGHILYAMYGRVQHRVAYAFFVVLLALSFLWTGWLIWVILGFLLRPAHPPTIMDDIPLDRRRKIIGYICMAVMVLCFIPVPIRI